MSGFLNLAKNKGFSGCKLGNSPIPDNVSPRLTGVLYRSLTMYNSFVSHPSGVIAGSSTLSMSPSATEDCSLKTEEKTERQCGQYATILRDRCRTVRQFRSDANPTKTIVDEDQQLN